MSRENIHISLQWVGVKSMMMYVPSHILHLFEMMCMVIFLHLQSKKTQLDCFGLNALLEVCLYQYIALSLTLFMCVYIKIVNEIHSIKCDLMK